jgi:hypothetical protein
MNYILIIQGLKKMAAGGLWGLKRCFLTIDVYLVHITNVKIVQEIVKIGLR